MVKNKVALENQAKQIKAEAKKKELKGQEEPVEKIEIPEMYKANIEGIADKDFEESIVAYQALVDKHKEYVETLDIDKLEDEEKIVIAAQDEWSSELNNKIYPLKSEVVWNNKIYSYKQVCTKIASLLDQYECEFSYALGVFQLYKFWITETKQEVNYNILNATSKILGESIKYKGAKNWKDLLIVNEFLLQNNLEYKKDNIKTTVLGMFHNNIVDRIQMNTPISNQEEPISNQEEQVEK